MKNKPRILIAGAGLGGLTAALALLKRGFDVEVFEQAATLREVGAGIQIAANGSHVLNALGLQDEVARLGTRLSGKQVRIWNTAQSWPLLDLGAQSMEKYGAPYMTLHRAELHQLLVDSIRALKPDAIRLDSKCSMFQQSADGVTLHAENGEQYRGDALIGADGVHSKVRQLLFGADQVEFTGTMAWRGVIPTADLPKGIDYLIGATWIGPDAHIVHYPIRNGELLNFVGIVERADWKVESWSAEGTVEECLSDFRGWHSDVQEIIRHITTPFKWALALRPPLPTWTDGRVTLLGDACHATLPLLAQGANMALEDGLVLARCLERHPTDIGAGLQSYEAARIARTQKLVRESADQLHRNSNPSLADPNTAKAYVEREWSKERVSGRYDWIFGYDASQVAVA